MVLGNNNLRPCSELPAKSPEETRRHQKEYDAILESMRKKEAQDNRDKKRADESRRKHEEKIAHVAQLWAREFLPNFAEALV
jgi:Skp family chaperone for outer membrane proteins